MKIKKNKKGFTLVELIIVVAIIAIIAVVIFVAIDPLRRTQEARNSVRSQEIDSILNAILKYEVDIQETPTGLDGTLRMLGTDGSGCDVPCAGVFSGIFLDDSEAEFNAGTYNNTQWDTDHVELSAGNTSGTYDSFIKDAGSSLAWGDISWSENVPTSSYDISYFNPAESLNYYSNNTYSVRTWYSTTEEFSSITPKIVLDCDGACSGTVRVRIGTSIAWSDYDFIDAANVRNDGTTSDYSFYETTYDIDSSTLGNYFFIQILHYTGMGTIKFMMDESGPTGPDPEYRVSGDGDGSQTGWTNDNGDYFMTAGLNQPTSLQFQARSCDDGACAGEIFTGPDGTASSYYSTCCGESLNVPTNQYFQYQANLESESLTVSPDFSNVEITYATPLPSACINLAPDLVDKYITSIPEDPKFGSSGKTYYAAQQIGSNRLKVVACGAELGETIITQR